MPDLSKLAKAQLRQLDANFDREIEPATWCTVQFNPESLKVSFANQLVQPSGSGDQRGTPARQFVGAGTTKLSLTLVFDVGSPQPKGKPAVDDVRKLTQRVAYFITPKESGGQPGQFLPPAVRFLWGSFQFDGMMDSLDESLELFSAEGRPLRATMTLALSQQKITKFSFRPARAGALAGSPPCAGGPGRAPAGTQPLTQAPAGATVQGLAAAAGRGDDWPRIAAANGIDNPRLLQPGQLLDLGVGV